MEDNQAVQLGGARKRLRPRAFRETTAGTPPHPRSPPRTRTHGKHSSPQTRVVLLMRGGVHQPVPLLAAAAQSRESASGGGGLEVTGTMLICSRSLNLPAVGSSGKVSVVVKSSEK